MHLVKEVFVADRKDKEGLGTLEANKAVIFNIFTNNNKGTLTIGSICTYFHE